METGPGYRVGAGLSKDVKQKVEELDAGENTPVLLLALSWLIPGAGHLLLGKRVRAVVFASVILAAFITGVLLSGELGVPRPGEPFSWLATAAGLGNGILYFLRLFWLNGIGGFFSSLPLGLSGGGETAALGFDYGKVFLISAGLMNLLVVLDASDIARGIKK